MTDIAQIAAGLSYQVKAAIKATRTDGDGEYWFIPGTARGVPIDLKVRGLEGTWLTPLGLAVRNHLISQRDTTADGIKTRQWAERSD